MQRMRQGPMAKITALVAGLTLTVSAPLALAAEQRQVVVKGHHMSFGTLTQAGALTLIFRDDGSGQTADFAVTGDEASTDRIDGRNYDLNGNMVGSGDRPGVALDVAQTYLTTDGKETISGSPAIQANAATIDVASYVNVLKANANVTYTSTTTLTNQTIGGPSNYQIVVVENTKLTMKGSSTGYGVLVIYDTSPGAGQASLDMEDQSKWYGVIISYTGDSAGNSDKIKLQFGKTPSAGAAGSGTRVFGAVVAEGRQVGVDFPSKAVADLYYSSEAVANVDSMVQSSTKFVWDKWRER